MNSVGYCFARPKSFAANKFLHKVFLGESRTSQIPDLPSSGLSDIKDGGSQGMRQPHREGVEVLQQHPLIPQPAQHPSRIGEHPNRSAKADAVPSRKDPGDVFAVFFDKLFHGVVSPKGDGFLRTHHHTESDAICHDMGHKKAFWDEYLIAERVSEWNSISIMKNSRSTN